MTEERTNRPRAVSSNGRPGRRWGSSGYMQRRKVCSFCVGKVRVIDYKDPTKLQSYISNRGKIEPRRKTGVCAKHQRALAIAIKRARHLALLPYVAAHLYRTGSVAEKPSDRPREVISLESQETLYGKVDVI